MKLMIFITPPHWADCVRYRVGGQQRALLMTTGTQTPLATGEGDEHLVAAVAAADAGKTKVEIPTAEELALERNSQKNATLLNRKRLKGVSLAVIYGKVRSNGISAGSLRTDLAFRMVKALSGWYNTSKSRENQACTNKS